MTGDLVNPYRPGGIGHAQRERDIKAIKARDRWIAKHLTTPAAQETLDLS